MVSNFMKTKKYSLDKTVENWPDKSITSTSSLYKWMEGREMPIHQIINLTIATKDSCYLDFIANQAGYSVIPQIKDKGTLRMFLHFSKVTEAIINGYSDEKK